MIRTKEVDYYLLQKSEYGLIYRKQVGTSNLFGVFWY